MAATLELASKSIMIGRFVGLRSCHSVSIGGVRDLKIGANLNAFQLASEICENKQRIAKGFPSWFVPPRADPGRGLAWPGPNLKP